VSTSIKYLRMYLHLPQGGRRAIGYLSQYGDILRVSFDDDYVQDAGRPVLSLSYQGANEQATRQILTASRDERLVRTNGRWPAFFQNLLPESHNRDRLARERGCSPDDEFELLAAAGHDLMGALEVEPVPAQEGIPDVVRHWHTAMGLDVLEPGFVEFPVEDAASIPGVVTKFSAVQEGRRYVVKRHGAAGSFILKLPSTRHPDLVANEFAGYQLCKALGLDCAEAVVVSHDDADLPGDVPFSDILAVKRFDRGPDGRRVHMEEFAQALQVEPRHKYGRDLTTAYVRMMRVLYELSSRPALDVRELMARFVTFILMGNTDAHLKNWAVLYADGKTPTMAPLYDPVCITAFFDAAPPTVYGQNRAIDNKLRGFGLPELEQMLKEAGMLRVPQHLKAAKELVRQAQAEWPALLKDAPGSMRLSITERLNGGLALTA